MSKRQLECEQSFGDYAKRSRSAHASRIDDAENTRRSDDGTGTTQKYPMLTRPDSQIRLLRVYAGREDALVTCELMVHDVEHAPAYRTISYTWGPEFPQRSIMVNGQSFMVRQACYYALWQARLCATQHIVLWVDSICINQADFEEKAHQIGMITDIFRQAEQTYVCIGPHADNSQLVFQHLAEIERRFGAAPADYSESCQRCVLMLDEDSGDFGFPTLSEDDDPVHSLHEWVTTLSIFDFDGLDEAMYHLSKRSYWERMWIYPEVALSRQIDVLCGRSVASIDMLRWMIAIFHWIALNNWTALDSNAEAEKLQVQCKQYVPRGPIWQVMVAYIRQEIGSLGSWLTYLLNGLKCSLPSDTIYASKDILKWDRHFEVPCVDYKKTAVKLVEEVLPHLGASGIGFPTNVTVLLDLVSDDAAEDSRHLQALWARHYSNISQEIIPRRASGQCDCDSPKPSQTAIWRSSLWHDEESGAAFIGEGIDGSLCVLFSREPLSRADDRKTHTQFLAQRPSGSLALTGVDAVDRSRAIVIGCITAQARPGDCLIRAPGITAGRYLVLRHAIGDIHEIVGYAAIDPSIKPQDNVEQEHALTSAGEIIILSAEAPAGAFMDFWLDAEDVLAHAFPFGDRHKSFDTASEQDLKLVGCSFTRSRFSSFATTYNGDRAADLDSSCPDCATNTRRQICIECGGDLTDVPLE